MVAAVAGRLCGAPQDNISIETQTKLAVPLCYEVTAVWPTLGTLPWEFYIGHEVMATDSNNNCDIISLAAEATCEHYQDTGLEYHANDSNNHESKASAWTAESHACTSRAWGCESTSHDSTSHESIGLAGDATADRDQVVGLQDEASDNKQRANISLEGDATGEHD